jgi:nitrite reductase/ring-hydroxylating ferredoxin subunit
MALHPVCLTSELPLGERKLVAAGGEKVLVFHLADGYFAVQSACTHIFAPLAKGKLVDGCQVQCPFHRALFDLRTGEVVQWANWPPGLADMLNVVRRSKALKTYPVVVSGNQVSVTV